MTPHRSLERTIDVLIRDLERRAHAVLEQAEEVEKYIRSIWVFQDDLNYHLNLFINEFLQFQAQTEWLRYTAQQSKDKNGHLYAIGSHLNTFFHIYPLPPPRLFALAVKANIRSEFSGTLKTHCAQALSSLDMVLSSILNPTSQAQWQRETNSVVQDLDEVEIDLQHQIGIQSIWGFFGRKPRPTAPSSALKRDVKTIRHLITQMNKAQAKMSQVYTNAGALRTRYTLVQSALSGIRLPHRLHILPAPLRFSPLEEAANKAEESRDDCSLMPPGWRAPGVGALNASAALVTNSQSTGYYVYDYRDLISQEGIATMKRRLAQTCQTHSPGLNDKVARGDESLQMLCAVMTLVQTPMMLGSSSTAIGDGDGDGDGGCWKVSSTDRGEELMWSFHVLAVLYETALGERERKGIRHVLNFIDATARG